MKFNKFTLYQWREGWTIEVGVTRPRNAPKSRLTEADFKRRLAESKKNYQLATDKVMFPTLEAAVAEIRRLCHQEKT